MAKGFAQRSTLTLDDNRPVAATASFICSLKSSISQTVSTYRATDKHYKMTLTCYNDITLTLDDNSSAAATASFIHSFVLSLKSSFSHSVPSYRATDKKVYKTMKSFFLQRMLVVNLFFNPNFICIILDIIKYRNVF